ncbi:MAG: hypothetical protein KDA93_22785, partial [Planctomycetaceae bacterium]|nr:hypothetical protein [Planctomycetaceae bacterium]
MQERLESTRASLAQARNVAHQFHTRMDTLQTSETGRRLATPNAARKMKLLTGFPERLDIAPFDSEMSQAERLMQSTDQPLSNFGQLLQQLIESSEFARLARQLKEVNDSYEEQVAPIRQAQATQLAAVDRQNRERADELRRILDSIEHIEREALAQITRRERAQAYAQDRSEIARLLQPFITPGTTQLREHWNDWKTTADRKPLSYQDLERVGALATDINGLRTYARIGGMRVHMSPKTARPLGGFPADYDNTLSNPTLLATVKRAQQLIKRHSVYLIEAGLLQP